MFQRREICSWKFCVMLKRAGIHWKHFPASTAVSHPSRRAPKAHTSPGQKDEAKSKLQLYSWDNEKVCAEEARVKTLVEMISTQGMFCVLRMGRTSASKLLLGERRSSFVTGHSTLQRKEPNLTKLVIKKLSLNEIHTWQQLQTRSKRSCLLKCKENTSLSFMPT